MLLVEEIHFPATKYLLKASKETPEQGTRYAQNQQQKNKNKFNNIFLVSKSQTPGTPYIPSIPILASDNHFSLGYYKIPMVQEKGNSKNNNFITETNIVKLSKYSRQQ